VTPGKLVLALLTAWALTLSTCLRPRAARCPTGYDLRTGIRPSGEFRCHPAPVGDPEWDGTWQRPERGTQPDGWIESRIYCTGRSRGIVVNERTVGCSR